MSMPWFWGFWVVSCHTVPVTPWPQKKSRHEPDNSSDRGHPNPNKWNTSIVLGAKIGIFRLSSKLLCNYLQVYLYPRILFPRFSLQSCFFSYKKQSSYIFFRIFAIAICHGGCDVLWGGWSCWVEHYILKGVTDALFLDFETSTIEYRTRTLQM